jgi:hypothetical protein
VNGFCLLKTLVPQAKLDTKNIFGCKILSALSYGWESILMIQKYTYFAKLFITGWACFPLLLGNNENLTTASYLLKLRWDLQWHFPSFHYKLLPSWIPHQTKRIESSFFKNLNSLTVYSGENQSIRILYLEAMMHNTFCVLVTGKIFLRVLWRRLHQHFSMDIQLVKIKMHAIHWLESWCVNCSLVSYSLKWQVSSTVLYKKTFAYKKSKEDIHDH